MRNQSANAKISLFFIFIASMTTLGLLVERHQSMAIGFAFFSGFFAYFWLCLFAENSRWLFPFGLFLRLLLFFHLPVLSDDVYRFLWDGRLLEGGFDPFALTPSAFRNTQQASDLLSNELYHKLNSPDYYSVYPPLNQLLFWIAVKFGGTSTLASSNILRTFILGAELGSYLLLRKLLRRNQRPEHLAFWYFLNPLVMLEFTGNLHFEAFVIFFLLLGIWFLPSSLKSGMSLGLAAGFKLVPLIFLPAFLFHFRWKKGLIICLTAGIVLLITFIPFLHSSTLVNIQNSLALYFQKFEFNASIYFLFRALGYWMTGYNTIETLGPYLSIVTLLGIISVALIALKRNWKLEHTLLAILFIYLSLATTVHPWYIITLVPLGLLAGFYFPVFWTLLIFTTYFGYQADGFELSQHWIVFEYVSLWIFIIFECVFRKNSFR